MKENVPKLVIFDIDNTLTESRSVISPIAAKALSELIDLVPVGIISGESMQGFDKQVISSLTHTKKENLYALPTEGAELYIYERGAWQRRYAYPIDDIKRRKILEELAKAVGITPLALGRLIEDRGTLITYAALGKDAPLEEKYAYDPSREKRRALIERLKPKLPGVAMEIGGSTSIDFTLEGIDKAFGVKKLLEYLHIDPADAVFVGDALAPGGNDEPVKADNVRTIETTSPEVTRGIIGKLAEDVRSARQSWKLIAAPKTVAYFCMEYGIEDHLPAYAGGLGILAGDIVRETGRREEVKLAAVGLIARRGMKTAGTESKDYGPEIAAVGFKKLEKGGTPLVLSISIDAGKNLSFATWEKDYGASKLFLLDTNLPENAPEDREIADHLYDFERRPRILQELLLGAGGVRLLDALGIVPDVYHMNEGHAGFGALALALESGRPGELWSERVNSVRRRIVATKHTILSGAGTYLPRAEFETFVAPYITSRGGSVGDVFKTGALDRDPNVFSATKFLLSLSRAANAVSVAHQKSEKKQYPQSSLISVTNGVDVPRWQAPEFAEAASLSDEAVWNAKKNLRGALVREANARSGSALSEDILTLVWARRFAAYKRPSLLWNDADKIFSLVADPHTPIQIIVSGKAHPTDIEGVRSLELIKKIALDPRARGRIAYMPDYSIETAKLLTKGADIWLNTPIPGFEASGTSGMKAGLNGAIEVSTDDGWVSEVPELREIGRIVGEEGIERALYSAIQAVAERFYADRQPGRDAGWILMMKRTIELVRARFSAERMMDDYIDALYDFNP